MNGKKELIELSERTTRILRGAVNKALYNHYKAGQYVVYYKNGKIYSQNKPGSKAKIISSNI